MSEARWNRGLCVMGLLVFLFIPTMQWSQVIAGSPEDRAYQAIARETDAKKRIELLDSFLKDFPNTADLAQIYEYYSISYRDLGDSDKEIAYAEKSLAVKKDPQLMVMLGRVLAIKGQDLPKAIQMIKDASALAEKIKDTPPPGISQRDWQQTQEGVISMAAQLLPYAMERYKQIFFDQLSAETDPNKIVSMLDGFTQIVNDPATLPIVDQAYLRAYSQLNNRDKVMEYGNKVLALKPDDVQTLVMMTNAYLLQPLDLTNAAAMAQKTVAAADALASLPKPSDLTDDAWTQQKNRLKALAYSTRGLVELQQDSTLDAAVADLEKARTFAPTDGVVQYRLGIAYWKDKKIDDAISALAVSAAYPSDVQTSAARLLETYYKAAHNGSTDGLKELIEKSKQTPDHPNGV